MSHQLSEKKMFCFRHMNTEVKYFTVWGKGDEPSVIRKKNFCFRHMNTKVKYFGRCRWTETNINYPRIYSFLLHGFFLLVRDLSAAFTITFSIVTKTTKQHTTFRTQSASYKFMYMLLIFFIYKLSQKFICRYQIVVPSTSRSPKWSLPTTRIYAYIPHTIFFTPPFHLNIRPKIWINLYSSCN